MNKIDNFQTSNTEMVTISRAEYEGMRTLWITFRRICPKNR